MEGYVGFLRKALGVKKNKVVEETNKEVGLISEPIHALKGIF